MIVSTYSSIGQFHLEHNEDYLVFEQIGSQQFCIAIIDGCSSGFESHFASSLIGKILKAIAKETYFREFVSKHQLSNTVILEQVLKALFSQTQTYQADLHLTKYDLLATLLLGIIDQSKQQISIICVGDGYVQTQEKSYIFEQNNQVDYFAYHLLEDYEFWRSKQKQIIHLNKIDYIALASDGIFSFDWNRTKSLNDSEIIKILFNNCNDFSSSFLNKAVSHLKENQGIYHNDDLSMIKLNDHLLKVGGFF